MKQYDPYNFFFLSHASNRKARLCCGSTVAHHEFLRPLLFEAGPLFPLHNVPATLPALFSCVLAGLLCGVLSAALTHALYKMEDLFAKLPIHWMWWPALGGLAVDIGGYFQPRALGGGYDMIGDLLNNHIALSVALSLLAAQTASIRWKGGMLRI